MFEVIIMAILEAAINMVFVGALVGVACIIPEDKEKTMWNRWNRNLTEEESECEKDKSTSWKGYFSDNGYTMV